MGIVTFFPLARGFLTGKYRPGQPPPPGTRLASPGPRGDQSSMLNDDNFAVLGRLEAFAESHDHTVGELALAWLAAQPGVGSVIAGATKPEQVEQNATAFDWKLSRGDLDELDEALRA
jgi:aryl-alcohol dehydrogenase-like predicted oxidoreductase